MDSTEKNKSSKKHNPLISWTYVVVAIVLIFGVLIVRDMYKNNKTKIIIKKTISDARQLATGHKFREAQDLLFSIIYEYGNSNPEQIKHAETFRLKLIEQHNKWRSEEAEHKRRAKKAKLARAEAERKRKLHNAVHEATRLYSNEKTCKQASALVNKAYQLCNDDKERIKVAAVQKRVEKALKKLRPWAAVVDFTLDKSVKVDLTGSSIAVKLEQALGRKYRLVTRSQLSKALTELRFQSSDLANKNNARKIAKIIGAEYLITGSVVQLGGEITVACQIVNVETGAIRQTAEASVFSTDNLSYMIWKVAGILVMTDAEKRRYTDEKFNYPKHLKAGGKAFLSRKYNDVAEIEYRKAYNSANKYYKQSHLLDTKDPKAHKACSKALTILNNFHNTNYYIYINSDAIEHLNTLKSQATAYLKTLRPPFLKDLKPIYQAKYAPLSGLASGSKTAQVRQKKWLAKLGFPLEVETKKIGIRLRLIPPGTFTMGSSTSEVERNKDESKQQVTMNKLFYCGKFEVTQAQWKRVIGNNPSNFIKAGDNAPVEQVSWNDCQEFLNKLCDLEGVPHGTYRLLTEAQWEYACRAGTTTAFYYGNSFNSSQANFDDKGVYRKKTVSVGSFKPNAWGLYDMHGNVREWCSDWSGISSGLNRIYRGGSWFNDAGRCRSAFRYWIKPSFRSYDLGFRIVRTIPANYSAHIMQGKRLDKTVNSISFKN
jgi:formylglycine-generating enzyme required for sulfatase activity